MGTIIRAEVSKDNKYWIPKHRYYELKHFCMQYEYWKSELRSIDLVNSSSVQMVIDGGEFNDPVYRAVENRERYLLWMEMIENAAGVTSPEFASVIIKGVTRGATYDWLAANDRNAYKLSRDAYYNLYRRFFWELDKIRG